MSTVYSCTIINTLDELKDDMTKAEMHLKSTGHVSVLCKHDFVS